MVIADDEWAILRHYDLFSVKRKRKKEETIFFCSEILFPLYIDFDAVFFFFCCVDVKRKGPTLWVELAAWRELGSMFKRKKKRKKIWAVPRQALQQCFSFFLVFFFVLFSDNFDFKILINYSKAFHWDFFFGCTFKYVDDTSADHWWCWSDACAVSLFSLHCGHSFKCMITLSFQNWILNC